MATTPMEVEKLEITQAYCSRLASTSIQDETASQCHICRAFLSWKRHVLMQWSSRIRSPRRIIGRITFRTISHRPSTWCQPHRTACGTTIYHRLGRVRRQMQCCKSKSVMLYYDIFTHSTLTHTLIKHNNCKCNSLCTGTNPRNFYSISYKQ